MQNQTSKLKSKETKNPQSVRLSSEAKRKLDRIMSAANKKKFGRKVMGDKVINLALDLLQESHIQMLQEQSMSNEDRKELLRQRYIEKRGNISKDEFTGFMMSAEFPAFISSISEMSSVAS